MTLGDAGARIDVHLGPDDVRSALEIDVVKGLTSTPKTLPPKWFYDDRGSELFDAITRLPEYYPTEAERSILRACAHDIAAAAAADTLVELGSGTGDKTRVLLEAMSLAGRLRRYIPFDVSEATLRYSAAVLSQLQPRLEVHGVVGDFDSHLAEIPRGGARMVAFLGGTIGNFEPDGRAEFLSRLVATMGPRDSFLLGTDLVKDPVRLVSAYDDSQGVTAEFNRNVLAVLNRELRADFVPEDFEHVVVWDAEHEWIEMRLRSRSDQRVELRDLGMKVRFAAGEVIRTEISAKFRREELTSELAAAGLELVRWWTDAAGDYAVSLARPIR